MGQDELNNLWKKILAEIQTEVSGANYLTLFKNTTLLSHEDHVATIAAPSAMIIDLLKKRFYDLVKKAVDKHLGGDTNIIFVPKAPVVSNSNIGPLFADAVGSRVIKKIPRVREDYTFQNFAVSGSNQLAYVSATTVAKKLGSMYNPLFIYGPVGVGKTHLMHAVANESFTKNQNKKNSIFNKRGILQTKWLRL
jgi:chromosomal replication initiator protein